MELMFSYLAHVHVQENSFFQNSKQHKILDNFNADTQVSGISDKYDNICKFIFFKYMINMIKKDRNKKGKRSEGPHSERLWQEGLGSSISCQFSFCFIPQPVVTEGSFPPAHSTSLSSLSSLHFPHHTKLFFYGKVGCCYISYHCSLTVR
ncbi:hypothetical protein ABZP36_032704 [Zizania latifolia]